MRFFTTEGPVNPAKHYCLPPLARLDVDEVLGLIAHEKYFLLHAPRQTGKTSCLLALAERLNSEARFQALYVNLETAQAAREDVALGMADVAWQIAMAAREQLRDGDAEGLLQSLRAATPPTTLVGSFLTRYCERAGRPLVLMLDEVDALVGDTLIALLRQLRSGYTRRPAQFPQSVILCGVRDLRDYRIHASGEKGLVLGGSAFNIKAESLRLRDFGRAEVEALLGEHTEETGQRFTAEALEQVWTLTAGQPWLVNALAHEVTWREKANRDRSRVIGAADILQAKEQLIQRRVTHLDQLAHKLQEPRVRRVIEPMLAGTAMGEVSDDDRQYAVDLGLVRRDGSGGLVVANPIYREVLPRVLASGPQDSLPRIAPSWLLADGSLDAQRFLEAFLDFWRQHGQPLLGSAPYHEIAPHLVFMAFLHRVANGEGLLDREYAIGSGRMDLCLRYRGLVLGIELKVWRDGEVDPLEKGLAQLDAYLAGLGRDSGWLVLFDRRSSQPPIAERTSAIERQGPGGRRVTIVRA
jgi:hypothetical protein